MYVLQYVHVALYSQVIQEEVVSTSMRDCIGDTWLMWSVGTH